MEFESFRDCDHFGLKMLLQQARSQVRKRGGSKKKIVDPKKAWVTKRGRVREGEVPPPALRAEAFENIDLATQKN